MITENGILDFGRIFPPDNGQWSDLSTWDDWFEWSFDPENELVWYQWRDIDLGIERDFNLRITCETNGIADYYVYTSNTGVFGGEETETIILNGDTDIPGFRAIYVRVAVKVTRLAGVQYIDDLQIETTTYALTEKFGSLDTSTCGGTITSRQLPLIRKFSSIVAIEITPLATNTAYDMDLYVGNYPTSTTLVPRIISKNRTTPTIALLGMDGSNKDGIVDVIVTGLPQQYMQGNNLLIK